MFGMEGLEDALGRLQQELDTIRLECEDGHWFVTLEESGRKFMADGEDVTEAYGEAWALCKGWRTKEAR